MSEKLQYQVVYFPEPVLRKRAEELAEIDDAVRETVSSMFRTMYEDNGVGLAAPQVGLRQRILVINPTGDKEKPEEELALINPTLIDRSGPVTSMEEGCLSFPGIYATIERPDRCTVRASLPDGSEIEREFEGFTSRVIQHEYDHLEGVLLSDRMSPAEKVRNKALLSELVEDFKDRRAKQAAKQ
ncbi:MAG: peptide deformylase [Planctomycetota bacterium]|jgi:peptide deformylase